MPEAENVMEEPQTALEEPADQDRYTKEELAESGIDDGWANSYIPPAKEERHPPGKTKGPSGILKAVLAACGVLAALLIGAFIALWDLGKNAGELRRVFTEEYTAELVEEYLNELRLSEGVSVTETVQDIAEETEEEKQEETDGAGEDTETEDPEEEYENSNMEIAGLTTLVKAGSGDEIEIEAGAPAVADGSGALSEYISPDKYYPLAYSSVGEDYFADALFVGDSRLQGFGMYSGLVSTYYCVTSFSVYKYDTMKVVQTDAGKVPIFDALPFDAFTKIYIKIGLNEMGGNEELFYQKYAELINMLRVYEPRAIVYIHAVLPVTAAKSASDKVHNNVSIYARNEQLKKFATEQRAYYVEVSEELLDEDGNLIPEATADGIHLKPKYMEPWKRKLMQQAVVLPR